MSSFLVHFCVFDPFPLNDRVDMSSVCREFRVQIPRVKDGKCEPVIAACYMLRKQANRHAYTEIARWRVNIFTPWETERSGEASPVDKTHSGHVKGCNESSLQQPWSWCGRCSSRASWWPACWGPPAPVINTEHKGRLLDTCHTNWKHWWSGLISFI